MDEEEAGSPDAPPPPPQVTKEQVREEVHELLLKAALNPFHVPHGRIEAREFDGRVRSAARRHLGYKGD